MIKIWLSLGLLGIIFQAIPEQADKPHANQNDGQNSSEKSKQPATGGTENIALPRPSGAPEKGSANSKAKQPDWCEKIISPVVTNWPLIAIAVWGILVARSTLQAIRWQAEETANATKAMRDGIPLQQKAAAAAKASADALVNSERAWMIVNIRWTQGKVVFDHSTSVEGSGNSASETTGVHIDLLYANEGRSPAWIIEEKVRLEVVLSRISSPSLDTEDTQFNERYEPVSVGKQSTNQHRLFGKGWNGSHAYVYGRIKYRDIFTPPPSEPRETWFGFRVNANGRIGRILSYEYNRFT